MDKVRKFIIALTLVDLLLIAALVLAVAPQASAETLTEAQLQEMVEQEREALDKALQARQDAIEVMAEALRQNWRRRMIDCRRTLCGDQLWCHTQAEKRNVAICMGGGR